MQDMQPDLNPEMSPPKDISHDIATPDGNAVDNEGAMAKADLYKLANYSFKLFKKMDDGQQLESWVQAKITKAADYIASVYHYLEYEMKFSEYGKKLDDSDVLSESQKAELKNKLMEAKAMVAKIKKDQAAKISGKKDKVEEGQEELKKTGDSFKTQHGVATKTSTGIKHTRTSKPEDDEDYVAPKKPSKAAKSAAEKKADKEKEIKLPKPAKGTRISGMKDGQKYEKVVSEEKSSTGGEIDRSKKGVTKHTQNPNRFSDEPHTEPKSQAKSQSAAEKAGAKADDKKTEKEGKAWEKAHGKGSVTRVKDGKKVDEALKGKQKNLDVDKDGDIEADDLADLRAKKKVDEASKPSAGMSKGEKSAVVKKAKAGEDIGKPGKSFDKVAKAAGGGEKGKKIAAAAMWKNAKKKVSENLEMGGEQPADPDLSEANMTDQEMMAKLEQLRATPEGRAKLAALLQSSDPEALNKLVGFKLSPGEKTTPAISDPEGVPQRRLKSAVYPSRNVGLNESADLNRMKEFLTRLNG